MELQPGHFSSNMCVAVKHRCEVLGCDKKVTKAGLHLALEYLELHNQQVHENGKEVDIGCKFSKMTEAVIK